MAPPVQEGPSGDGGTTDVVRTLADAAREFAAREPALTAAAVLGGAVAVVVLWLVVRRLLRSRGAELRRALAAADDVTVLTHPNPDPDALASALAVACLARDADTDAAIRYPGQIRHQENRAFRTVLDLDCDPIEGVADIRDETVVLVDHNEPRGFPGADRVEPYAVVDHHPGDGSGEAFTDVRPDYGACATILAEYYEQLGVTPADPDESGHADGPLDEGLATGLLYGVLADTNHLTRGCSAAEFGAARFLYPGVDEDTLDRIANPQVDAEVLEVKATAITERRTRPPFAVSYVGELSNADAIPQAADELIRLEAVSAVVVFGERDGSYHLSGRSRDDRVHMGEALSAALDGTEGASAGGHARMGGGQVDLDRAGGLGVEELCDQLFASLGGER